MKNQEIALVKEVTKILPIVGQKITTPQEMTLHVNNLSLLNKELDRVKAHKDLKLKPALATVKAIRADYVEFESKLEEAIQAERTSISVYQTEQKKIAEEKENKIIDRVGEGKGKLKASTAIKKLEGIDKPEGTVTADAGMIKFRTVKKFRVVDFSKIISKYLMVDEKAIKEDINVGVDEIAGIEIYTEEVPVNYR
jgi:hypothetical protein